MKRFVLFTFVCAAASMAALILFGVFHRGSPESSPYAAVAAVAAALACASFFFGLSTGDYSWVDRLWSIAPVVFAWIYAAYGGWNPGSLAAAALVSLWGARLSFNFARRGGYAGTEDYRWAALRGRIRSPLAWQAFNALFICIFQFGVLVLISTPLARIAAEPSTSLGLPFAAVTCLALLFLVYEAVADGQQWRFQNRKIAYLEALGRGERPADPDGDMARGFRSSGLFAFSRHPNYFGELGFWFSVYFLGCSGGGLVHWSAAGWLSLLAVFVGSIGFTEKLSAAKYPEYSIYKKTLPAVLPKPRRRPIFPAR